MIRASVPVFRMTAADRHVRQVCARSVPRFLGALAVLGLTAGCTTAQNLPPQVKSDAGAAQIAKPILVNATVEKPGKKAKAPAFLPEDKNPNLSAEERLWALAAWHYFAPPPREPVTVIQAPAAKPQGNGTWTGNGNGNGNQPAQKPATPPRPTVKTMPSVAIPAHTLVPARAGIPVATMWSVGDQVAALVLARRMELIDDRELDKSFSTLLAFLNTMALSFDQLPNRFYSTETNAMLGGDLKPGNAGWSSVDIGRLLIWLKIAAREFPQYEPYIRNALARWDVCLVASDQQQLVTARPSDQGTQYNPETARGYDAYVAQGYRAWGMALPVPLVTPADSVIKISGVPFPILQTKGDTPPVMTTPPAYMGFEFGFEPIAPPDAPAEEMAGGRTARDLMLVLQDIQAQRFAETGSPVARADFRRGVEPATVYGTVMTDGYPWSTSDAEGKVRGDLALVSTRAAFAMSSFFDTPYTKALDQSVLSLFDPDQGWYEGRYEATGGYETTRTSATNAFVLEALAYRHFRPLFPGAARPAGALVAVTREGPAACKLPMAVGAP